MNLNRVAMMSSALLVFLALSVVEVAASRDGVTAPKTRPLLPANAHEIRKGRSPSKKERLVTQILRLRAQHRRGERAARALTGTARRQLSDGATTQDRRRWRSYMRQLQERGQSLATLNTTLDNDLDRVLSKLRHSPSAQDLDALERQLADMNRSYTMQYAELQRQMQQENRQITTLSHVMKARHDTVMSVIGKMR